MRKTRSPKEDGSRIQKQTKNNDVSTDVSSSGFIVVVVFCLFLFCFVFVFITERLLTQKNDRKERKKEKEKKQTRRPTVTENEGD